MYKRQIGNAAFAPAQEMFALQIGKGKVVVLRAAHDKGTVALCELGKNFGIVLFAFIIHIDGGFRAGQADIHLPGDNGCHDFIRTFAVDKLHIQSLVFKIPQRDSRILGRIEDRMGHFADRDFYLFLLGRAAGQQADNQEGCHKKE